MGRGIFLSVVERYTEIPELTPCILHEFVEKIVVHAASDPKEMCIRDRDMGADNFILASENQMSQGLTSSESIVFAVVFILMFAVCGYLLIYNIFCLLYTSRCV